MPERMANWLHDMEYDEVSTVDRPANQHAKIVLAKRAPEEDLVEEYFNEQGEAVDLAELNIGDVVYDSDGQAFAIEDENEEHSDDRELETVGKSLADQVREDLSKAFTEVDRDEVISKAMGEISKAEQRAEAAEAIAKSERDLRLTREYISKAEDYGVPGVTPQELGPVLMRAAEILPYEDCVILHKALSSSGEAFAELGVTGGGSNLDAFGVIEALTETDSELSKALSVKGADRHEAITKAFEDDPSAYDRYMSERRG